jgi:hypothetical protein
MKTLRYVGLTGIMASVCLVAQPENDLLKASAQAQQAVTNLKPVLQTFVTDLQSGDIDVVEKHLQEHASALDVSPVIQFMQNHGPALQGLLGQAITEIPVEKLPVDWQKNIRAAQELAISGLPSLTLIIDNLNALQPYITALPSSINALCNVLRSIKTTPEFETLKNDIATVYEDKLSPALMALSDIQFKKIKIALDELAKKQTKQPFKADLIIMGFDETRRMFPQLVNSIAQTTSIAEKIGAAVSIAKNINPLPAPGKKALDSVDEQSATFLKSMQFLEKEMNKALGK